VEFSSTLLLNPVVSGKLKKKSLEEKEKREDT
jgi:hypothetical protein